MADVQIKQHDTWPPLMGTASDAEGPLPLAAATGTIKVILKGQTATVTGTVTVIDPPDADGFNWSYAWAAGDTSVAGVYNCELEITWDPASTPPHVETVPNGSYKTLEIVADLG